MLTRAISCVEIVLYSLSCGGKLFYLLLSKMEGRWWKWCTVGVVGVTGIGLLALKRYFGATTRYLTNASMLGKTVIITGGNTGIGKATALELVKLNARVILACRDHQKGEAAQKYIQKKTNEGEVIVKTLDLASLASIKKFAEEINRDEPKLDVLINNAGVFQCPFSHTEDGFETQMGVNHLGHFYLTNLLLEKLKKSCPSRVVIVSSSLAKRGELHFDNLNSEKSYDPKKGYSNSKLANNLFARELAKRVEDCDISVSCVHPGMVFTDLGRHVWPSPPLRWLLFPLGWFLLRNPYEGCQTVLYCAAASEMNEKNGYFGNCKQEPWPLNTLDDGVAKKLWEESERLVGLT